MSFLTGSTKELTPPDMQQFRQQLLQFIQGQGLGTAINGPAGGGIDLAPYQKMFADRRAFALGQAKESAGNLTGSGYGNALGTAAGRSVSEENAFLANLMEQARQSSANRFTSLVGSLPGFAGQTAYQPGFLDYLFQGAGAAAPYIARKAATGGAG